MAATGTLHDAFLNELRDTYDAEKQLTKALAKLAKAATSPILRDAFESHLEETRGQIERLDQVFESVDEKPRGKHCEGIAGIIEEGKAIMEEDFDEATMDACLIAAGQRAEHYEIAAYGTLVAWARGMGHTEAADLLQETLDEERPPTRSSPPSPKVASISKRPTPRIPAGRKKRRQSAVDAAGPR
jgi:ferritin-like metal-binding protein YciE